MVEIKPFFVKLISIFCSCSPRRLIRSSRPTEIFQPPQQGFFSVQGLSSHVAASRKVF